jgi:hypothetical protein
MKIKHVQMNELTTKHTEMLSSSFFFIERENKPALIEIETHQFRLLKFFCAFFVVLRLTNRRDKLPRLNKKKKREKFYQLQKHMISLLGIL